MCRQELSKITQAGHTGDGHRSEWKIANLEYVIYILRHLYDWSSKGTYIWLQKKFFHLFYCIHYFLYLDIQCDASGSPVLAFKKLINSTLVVYIHRLFIQLTITSHLHKLAIKVFSTVFMYPFLPIFGPSMWRQWFSWFGLKKLISSTFVVYIYRLFVQLTIESHLRKVAIKVISSVFMYPFLP